MRLLMRWICFALMIATATACADPVSDFIASDANGDRLLQPNEFRNFVNLRADAGGKAAQRVRSFRAYGRAFAHVDTNDDGAISGDELRALASGD